MKTSITAWLGSMLLAIFVTSVALADDHMINGINMSSSLSTFRPNLCKLNPDVTLDDYHALIEDYFDWAEKNSVDPVFVRQFPLFSHQNLRNPWPYDFVELLGSDYERWGKSWDLWLTSEDGMALNQRWQSLAMCHVKQAHGQMLYADTEALETTTNATSPGIGAHQKSGLSNCLPKARRIRGPDQRRSKWIDWLVV